MKEVAKKNLQKAPSRKDEVTADDLDKEEESQDTQESETPSKVTLGTSHGLKAKFIERTV